MSIPNLKARALPPDGAPAGNPPPSVVNPALNEAMNLAGVLLRMTSDVDEAVGGMGIHKESRLGTPPRHEYDFVKAPRCEAGCRSGDITRLRTSGKHMLSAQVNTVVHSDYSQLCFGSTALRRDHAVTAELKSENFESAAGR